MKKLFSLLTSITLMLTLSACGQEKCDPIIKEVPKEVIVEKEVIKTVEVPVDTYIDYEVEMERKFEPGTYFKATEADENGVRTFATVVVDRYGQIAGVQFGTTLSEGVYKYDAETKELFYYVKGIEDVIPNAYRKVDLTSGKLPSIKDGLTTEDLIEGYPAHEERIATLTDIKANELQLVSDKAKDAEVNTWTEQMDRVAEKIVADQGTYGINLYKSGELMLTNSVENVDIEVEEQLRLVQDILDNDAKLGENTVLADKENPLYGTYKPGTYYVPSNALQSGTSNEVFYNTAVVVVDEFGRIAGVKLDETYSKDGVSTTKEILGADYGMKPASPIGKEWFEQIDELEAAIVRNQSLEGFRYVDAEDGTKVEELPGLNDAKDAYKNEVKLDGVAGTTILVEGLLNPVKEILSKPAEAKLDLKPGTYYNTDENGNIMTMTVANVFKTAPKGSGVKVGEVYNDKNTTHVTAKESKGAEVEAQIVAMSLDTVYAVDQAMFNYDGEQYELYTYEMGNIAIDTEIEKNKVFIYKDGETYRYAQDISKDMTADGKDFEVGDAVRFDFEGYDEKATIQPVKANSTKHALKDQYNMATAENQLEWYEQANAYTDAFINKSTAHVFNMVTDTTTDSVAGLTIDIKAYNELVVDTYRIANDADKKALNQLDPNSLEKLNQLFYNVDTNAQTQDFKLADGTYVATSDLPNADGGFYVLTMTVYNNQITSLFIDETYVKEDGSLTTKSAMGEDYRVTEKEGKLVKSDDKDDKTYAEAIAKLAKEFATGNLKGLVEDYDYELDTELEEDADFLNKEEANAYAWNNAFEKVLLQGLRARVPEVMENLVDEINRQLTDEDFYIVASDSASAGAKTVTIDPKLFQLTDNTNTKIDNVELDIESEDKLLDADAKDNVLTLEAETEDFPQSTKKAVTITAELDDYPVVEKVANVNIQSAHDYKQKVLNDIDATLDQEYATLVGGKNQEIVIDAHGLELSAGRVGETEDANNTINWKLQDSDSLIITSKEDQEGLKLVGSGAISNVRLNEGVLEFIVDTTGELTFKVDGQDKTVNVTESNGKHVTYSSVTKGTGFDTDAEARKAFKDHVLREMFNAGSKITVETSKDKEGNPVSQGSLTIRAWFDAYEQDDRDGRGTYQKGEAYKDFTFTVLSEKEAIKRAKATTKVGEVLSEVTVKQEIDLTDLKDIKIDGLAMSWQVNNELDGAVKNYYVASDKSIKGYENVPAFEAKIEFASMKYADTKVLGKNATDDKYYTLADDTFNNGIFTGEEVKQIYPEIEFYEIWYETYERDVLLAIDSANTKLVYAFDENSNALDVPSYTSDVISNGKANNLDGSAFKITIDGYEFTSVNDKYIFNFISKTNNQFTTSNLENLYWLIGAKSNVVLPDKVEDNAYITHDSINLSNTDSKLNVTQSYKDSQRIELAATFTTDTVNTDNVYENEFIIRPKTVEAIEKEMKEAIDVDVIKPYINVNDVINASTDMKVLFEESIKQAVAKDRNNVVYDLEVTVKDNNGKKISSKVEDLDGVEGISIQEAIIAQLGGNGATMDKGDTKDIKFTIEVEYTAKDETERSFTKEINATVFCNADDTTISAKTKTNEIELPTDVDSAAKAKTETEKLVNELVKEAKDKGVDVVSVKLPEYKESNKPTTLDLTLDGYNGEVDIDLNNFGETINIVDKATTTLEETTEEVASAKVVISGTTNGKVNVNAKVSELTVEKGTKVTVDSTNPLNVYTYNDTDVTVSGQKITTFILVSNEEELTSALKASKNVALTNDITLTIEGQTEGKANYALTIDKLANNVIVDGNGHKLIGNVGTELVDGKAYGSFIQVYGNGTNANTVTFKDVVFSASSTDKLRIDQLLHVNGGVVQLDGVTFEGNVSRAISLSQGSSVADAGKITSVKDIKDNTVNKVAVFFEPADGIEVNETYISNHVTNYKEVFELTTVTIDKVEYPCLIVR